MLLEDSNMFSTNFSGKLALCAAVLLSGCASYGSVDGVNNLWRDVPIDAFEKGVTTQAHVLELLGPPSQLISLHDQTVYYYLTEEMSGQGKIFIVWNQASAKSQYDRAIFFFNMDGVLQEFAYSKEEITR
jgi:outer membrane protein assembly factor BamE (lipoprotein component of BamABCDE complex)